MSHPRRACHLRVHVPIVHPFVVHLSVPLSVLLQEKQVLEICPWPHQHDLACALWLSKLRHSSTRLLHVAYGS